MFSTIRSQVSSLAKLVTTNCESCIQRERQTYIHLQQLLRLDVINGPDGFVQQQEQRAGKDVDDDSPAPAVSAADVDAEVRVGSEGSEAEGDVDEGGEEDEVGEEIEVHSAAKQFVSSRRIGAAAGAEAEEDDEDAYQQREFTDADDQTNLAHPICIYARKQVYCEG